MLTNIELEDNAPSTIKGEQYVTQNNNNITFASTGIQSIPTDFIAAGYKIFLGKK